MNINGKRALDVFPEGHPLRAADSGSEPTVRAHEVEVVLQTAEGPRRRAGVRIQPVMESGAHMGTLITLRDWNHANASAASCKFPSTWPPSPA